MSTEVQLKVFDVGHPNAKCVTLIKDGEEIDSFGIGWKNPLSEEQIKKEARKFFKGLPKNTKVLFK